MDNLTQRLRDLMQEHDMLTEKELSVRTGIAQSTINRILNGETKTPRKSALKAISKFFNISLGELVDPKLSIPTEPQHFSIVPILHWDNIQEQLSKLIKKNVSDFESITVAQKIEKPAFALIVNNQELEPRFTLGTKLIFKTDSGFKSRDYVLVNDRGNISLKQVLIDGQAKYLKSLNSELNYPIVRFSKYDVIMGILIQALVDYET